jgi:ubiquinone/menaquinone biosynthesis C-methylase UbiE
MAAPLASPTNFDTAMAQRLDRLYASRQAIAQRVHLRKAVAARSGEVGVDVGCGLGHMVSELARDVAPHGRILAIDTSPDMIRAAEGRATEAGLARLVKVSLGDAVALDLADESVDFVIASQVYCYVRDVARGIREAARVLRRGGRLVILDTDWDMCVYQASDPALTRRILDGRWRFEHSDLPRRLHRLFRETELTLVSAAAFPIIETRYDPDSFGAGLAAIACAAAVRHGVSAEDADAWMSDISSRPGDGDYFFCLNRFIFVATK